LQQQEKERGDMLPLWIVGTFPIFLFEDGFSSHFARGGINFKT
jgi:hypothetical protein